MLQHPYRWVRGQDLHGNCVFKLLSDINRAVSVNKICTSIQIDTATGEWNFLAKDDAKDLASQGVGVHVGLENETSHSSVTLVHLTRYLCTPIHVNSHDGALGTWWKKEGFSKKNIPA